MSGTTHQTGWHRAFRIIQNSPTSFFRGPEQSFDEQFDEATGDAGDDTETTTGVKGKVKKFLAGVRKAIGRITSKWWYRWFVQPALSCSLQTYLCPVLPAVIGYGLDIVPDIDLGFSGLVRKAISKIATMMANILPDLSGVTTEGRECTAAA